VENLKTQRIWMRLGVWLSDNAVAVFQMVQDELGKLRDMLRTEILQG
jgi:hypothetical protein